MGDLNATARSESLRKLTHLAFGFFAFSLRWLTTTQAALVALAAIVFNRFIFPHLGARHISRGARGYDRGMITYPVAVFLLIVAFPRRPEIAAAAWAILAFGDGGATLVGIRSGGAKIPWNARKSVAGTFAFVVFGLIAAWLAWNFVGASETYLPPLLIVGVAVAVSALVETLPLAIDDNATVPLAASVTLALLVQVTQPPALDLTPPTLVWLLVNTILAVAGYAARSVDLSGAAGGWVIGATMIVFSGWPLYAVLLTFFVIGSAATRAGFRAKSELGLAQERGGRRGFSHAFSNTGVAAILALLIAATRIDEHLLWVAAAASLATAAADTVASEIGQLLGRRAFLPLSFRRVERGTEGAVSVEGTLAGLLAAVVTAAAAVGFRSASGSETQPLREIAIITAAAVAGSYIESVAGSWNRRREERVPNGTLNFFNTALGAALALLLLAATGE